MMNDGTELDCDPTLHPGGELVGERLAAWYVGLATLFAVLVMPYVL